MGTRDIGVMGGKGTGGRMNEVSEGFVRSKYIGRMGEREN